MTPREVLAIRFQTPDLFTLHVARAGMAFTPGDCVALFNDRGDSRPYSIASGTHDDHLEFLIRRMPGGEVTSWLANLRPGDALNISQPFGWFRPGPGTFIATGVGIAPFLSVLRSNQEIRPTCLYGLRHVQDALHLDLLHQHTNLHLAVSREAAPNTHHGRITDLLEKIPAAPNASYYLCGLDAMITDVSTYLATRGIPPAHIHREVFFHA